MRTKKSRKPLQEPRGENKNGLDSAGEASSVVTESFIEGLKQNNGPPLHSTALEDDLAAADEEPLQRKLKKQAANQGKENKTKPKSTPQKSKKTLPTTNGGRRPKSAKRKSSGDADSARPVKKQKVKNKKRITDPPSLEQSGGESPSGGHKAVFTSDEELDDGDDGGKPNLKKQKSPKRARTSSSDKSRKSSSGSGERPAAVKRPQPQKRPGASPWEVLLHEFLLFCGKYKETVESKAVKMALEDFTSNVKEQLTEKICSSKQLKSVMRENARLASAIRTKRQRLLDAKNELIKSERQLYLQQKNKCELEQNLKDLSQSKMFIQNLREINKRYLQHRRKNPNERETYGASSVAALLTEAKHFQTTEVQLKGINHRLQETVPEK